MAFLTDEQKRTFKPLINGAWTVLCISIMLAIATRWLMKEVPFWLEWVVGLNSLILALGAIGAGLLVAARNPLVK